MANIFDEWGQRLGPHQVGQAPEPVAAIYDGRLCQGNPCDIPLNAGAKIRLEAGPHCSPGNNHMAQ